MLDRDLVAARGPRAGQFDAVRLEVLWSRLVSIVEEAETVLSRTSRSSTVGEAQDHAAAILDTQGQILAQSRSGTPGFIAILGRTTRTMLTYFPVDTLRAGDVLITNDPWICAGHLNDINLLMPVVHGGKVVAFVANTAHLNDIGGRGSAESLDLFEEGLRIPPSKLYRAGAANEDVLNFIQANSRTPKQVMGDLQAQFAANAMAGKRLGEMLDEHSLDDLEGLSAEIQARTESAMRKVLERLPDGTYHGEVWADGYDEGLLLAVAVRVKGSDVEVDYAGTSPQVPRAINCPFNLTYAASMFPFRCLAPRIPMAEGALRPISVTAPEGCIVNPRFPAAVLRRSVVIHNAQAPIYQALSQLAPERIPPDRVIAHSGCIFSFRFRGEWNGRGAAYRDGLPVSDRRFFQTYLFMGGQGATLSQDGRNALSMPENISNVPVEVMEARVPVLIERKELLADSGGAGRHRGGLGQRVAVRVLADEPVVFVPASIRAIHHRPPGIKGGEFGGAAAIVDTDSGKVFHARMGTVMPHGAGVTVLAPGGGGAGAPVERDPLRVADDVRLGYVTHTAARRDYKVALAADGAVDWEETKRLRNPAAPDGDTDSSAKTGDGSEA